MFTVQSNAGEIADKIGDWQRTITTASDAMAEEFWSWQVDDIQRNRPNMQETPDGVETIIPWKRTRVRQRIVFTWTKQRGRPRGSWAGSARSRALVIPRAARGTGVPQPDITGMRPELMEKLETRMRALLQRHIRYPD